MSFILRLQNLPWSANAMDIRNFFKGLGIPDGGVHIVGGEIGDAFIAFSNDEDARQAMLRDGGKIKEIQVRLLLSSRTEMQKVIDTARLATAQYATLGKSTTAVATPAVHTVAPTQIQPPVITSNLTGLVSKQVSALQTHPGGTILSNQTLMQLQQQQTKLNALLKSNDVSNDNKNDDRSSSEKDRKRDSDRRDRSYRSPRSRSRDRSKRSRTRSRSRDRLGRTRRRRSRSRERRNRHRRSSSRERSRSRERNNRDIKKELPNPWAVNPNPATTNPIVNDLLKMQKLDDIRNPVAFQGNTGLLLPDNAPLFTTSSSLNKPLIVTNNLITSSYDQKTAQNDKIEGRCVKISKMDRITGYGEIRRFFAGLQIHQNGIKMINDKSGRRTGVAYIRFARLEFRKMALLQSGLTLRDSKVEVSPLPDEDFDDAVDSFKPRYDHYRRGGSYRSDDDDRDSDDDDDYYRKDRDRSRSRSRERDRDRNRSKNRDDSDDDDLQIISNTSRDNNTDNDEDDVKLVSDSSNIKNSFTTLLIKDIPPFTKEQDIIKMFSNYTLVHILICKNVDGTKANYAYAKFHRAEDAKSALKEKACHLIAYRNVTVSRVSDDIYDKDKNEINSDINLLDSELQSSTAKQQTNILVSSNIARHEEKDEHQDNNTEIIKIKTPLDPRLQKAQTTQNAYLMNQFDNSCNNVWGPNAPQTTSSVWQMNMGNGGNSFMNGSSNDSSMYQARKDPRLSRFDNPNAAPAPPVQPWSNPADMNDLNNFTNILSNNNNNVPLIRDPRQRNIGTTLYNNATSPPSIDENSFMSSVQNYALQSNVVHSVVLSNLEPKTSDRDVIDFFSEVGLIPQRVHFLSNQNGMPTGDCFCEFSTPEEARRALQKHNYQLGMNSIKIDLIPSEKIEGILSSFQNDSLDIRNDPRNNNYNNNSNSSNSNNSNNYRDRDRGGNDNFRDRMNNNNNSNNNFNNYRGGNNSNFRGGNNNNSNNNMGRGFRNNNSMNRMNNNNNKMNPFNNNGGNNNNNSNSKPPSLLSLPTPPLGIAGSAFNNNGPGNNNNPPDFGKAGCVVSMENVPYRAGVDDILDFFNGFMLDKQNIMRRYNDNGTPTGDARVCFISPSEAKRAMEIKKYGKIFNRTIYLKLLDDM